MPHVIPLREFLGAAPPVGGVFTGDPSLPARALPLPSPTVPTSYEAARLFGRAFQDLPAWIQAGIARSIPQVSLSPGEVGGSASFEHAAVRFPDRGEQTVRMPWGSVAPEDVARHELGHVGLDQTILRPPDLRRRLAETLRAAFATDPGSLMQATSAHEGVAGIEATQPRAETVSVSDVVRSRGAEAEAQAHKVALHEFFASLLEHRGQPVRMPWPTPHPEDAALRSRLEAIRRLLIAPSASP